MDSITLENFRCFRERQTAHLAPLTLLVGENSTGKTSFMALIRALWDIAYEHEIPDFKEEPYDLGSYEEIVHHRGARGGRAKTFEAGFNVSPSLKPNGQSYCFEVTFGKTGTAPIPVGARLAREGGWIEVLFERNYHCQVSFGTPRGAWRLKTPYIRRVRLDAYDDRISVFFSIPRILKEFIDRRNIELITPQGSSSPTDEDFDLIEQLNLTLDRDSYRYREETPPYASAPVRSYPRRTYDPTRLIRDAEGVFVPMYLANMYFSDQNGWARLRKALENFGRDAGLFDEISIRPLGKKDSEPFQVQVRKFGRRLKGPQRNLVDVGYGVSQVLPVITELLSREAPSLFLLQQPEVHLHPSAQAALGSLFCQVAGPERQLIVETHSDHLLDRVRMDVRDEETKLKPEDVSVLYFEREDLDVHIHSLRFDEQGNVLDAPPGYRQFFMEEMRRSLWKR
ncbi:MAG: AAA family ATPase [Desulfurellaceae bacterium]|nr:AAA family ATPase [Desulfurellaceae bacterium]